MYCYRKKTSRRADGSIVQFCRPDPVTCEGTLHRAKPSKFESKRSADFWGWCICAVRPVTKETTNYQ